MALSPPGNEVDGRRRRRARNRALVVDSLVDLFDRGIYQPSVREIAEGAGVSERSVFRYFDDLDDLSQAAITRLVERARPLLAVPVDTASTLHDRARAFVAARHRLFRATAHGARAARITAHRRPPVARQLRESRRHLRREVEEVFAREIEGGEQWMAPALDVLTSFEAFDLLTVERRLSAADAEAVVAGAVERLASPRPRR